MCLGRRIVLVIAALVFAVTQVRERFVGDLGAWLILGQTLGRMVSGSSTRRAWPFFRLKPIGGVVLLCLLVAAFFTLNPEL